MKDYYLDGDYMGLMPNGTYQRFPTIDEYHELYHEMYTRDSMSN